jgi:VanZ family protein
VDPLTNQDVPTPGDGPIVASTTSRAPNAPGFRITMAVVWTAVILVLCWTPRQYVMEAEEKAPWFAIPNFDKFVHWGIFLVFAVLWLRTSGSRWKHVYVALAGVALAVITEVVQGLPQIGRDGSVNDGITDLIGLALGLALARWFEPPLAWLESRVLGSAGRR